MLYIGFFKRIIPFVLTFAAGLLLASIFVPVGLPNLDSWAESRRSRDCHRKKQLWIEKENIELREKVRTLRAENEELRRNATVLDDTIFDVPPVPLDEHHPPAPPRRPNKPHRSDVLQ